MIKAIQTQYKGYSFRSRLEARWAVFFDALGAEWEYEAQGYDLGELGYYLPDFWLPMHPDHNFGGRLEDGTSVNQWPNPGIFVEIKGAWPSDNEIAKIEKLAKGTKHHTLLFVGLPGARRPHVATKDKLFSYPRGEQERYSLDDYYTSEYKVDYIKIAAYCLQFCNFGQCMPCGHDADFIGAILAARSARFEHGQSGATII